MKKYEIEYKLKIEVNAESEEQMWKVVDYDLKELLESYHDDPVYLLCALHMEPRVVKEIV